MTTKRKGDAVSTGWCITGYHDLCDSFYMKQSYAEDCACTHHAKTDTAKKPTKK